MVVKAFTGTVAGIGAMMVTVEVSRINLKVQKVITLFDCALIYDGYVRRLVSALFCLLYGSIRAADGAVSKAISDGKYMTYCEYQYYR